MEKWTCILGGQQRGGSGSAAVRVLARAPARAGGPPAADRVGPERAVFLLLAHARRGHLLLFGLLPLLHAHVHPVVVGHPPGRLGRLFHLARALRRARVEPVLALLEDRVPARLLLLAHAVHVLLLERGRAFVPRHAVGTRAGGGGAPLRPGRLRRL